MNDKNWLDKDKNLIWHSMFRYGSGKEPLLVKKAEGINIIDEKDNHYVDGLSGLWCVNIGYGREEMARCTYDQMVEMSYTALTNSHLPAVELADKLNKWLDDEYVFYFSNSGSEANETAFKLARQYHHQNDNPGRYKFISRYRAYHGSSFASLAATGQSHRKYKYEPLAPGFLHIPPPDCYRCPFNKEKANCELECVSALEQTIIYENKNTIAGVIMEPVITGGGILVTRDDYFKKVEEICNAHGVLFIVDEVICGFGRMGNRFGYMQYNVSPDIITMAKGITSAYLPLSVTAVKRSIFDKFKEPGDYEHFRHVNTYGGHPAACKVAVKNMEIIEEENLIDNTKKMGNILEKKLQILLNNKNVGDIRCKGLLAGIEMVEDKKTKKPLKEEKVGQIIAECKDKGLIIGKNSDTIAEYNNILTLAPPLIISEKDIDFIVDILRNVISSHFPS
ncbi:aminotransferase [Natranaerofaba carboxydovora]|uniref:aminotransferase n=1 Tax=Natranaerofaba carboxydovora TaxID=2742683 RepID=UPI001F14170A|nr:aminotransferase [Natranaerofaba carboxydovora]UMZ74326.1 Taurine--pyruvate aminotransferase [Natranaerofaba carboxydovora]